MIYHENTKVNTGTLRYRHGKHECIEIDNYQMALVLHNKILSVVFRVFELSCFRDVISNNHKNGAI